MNLEAHPTEHYVVILIFYNIGLLINILMGAHLVTQSSLNAMNSIKIYFKVRWPAIAARWFLCLCLFLIVWENPSVVNLERFMPNIAAHMGVAGFLGFASDALWDKVIAMTGLQKDLPPLPQADNGGQK